MADGPPPPRVKITSTRVYLSGNGGASGGGACLRPGFIGARRRWEKKAGGRARVGGESGCERARERE